MEHDKHNIRFQEKTSQSRKNTENCGYPLLRNQ